MDIGSTTTDFIPLVDGQPVTIGHTDPKRLVNGELIYSGVERSPVCAIANLVPWRAGKCPMAQEVFATTWDVYLTLGDLPEEPNSLHTADRRGATKAAAHDRLARQICADRTMFSESDALAMAESLAKAQVGQDRGLRQARAVAAAESAGDGGHLGARRISGSRACWRNWKSRPRSFRSAANWGPSCRRAAAAHAVAVLRARGRDEPAGASSSAAACSICRTWPSASIAGSPGKQPLASVLIVGGGALADADPRGRPDARSGRRSLAPAVPRCDGRNGRAGATNSGPHAPGLAVAHWSPDRVAQAAAARSLKFSTSADCWTRCRPQALPSCRTRWQVTSDSIAAHVALRLGAAELVLLKSILPVGRFQHRTTGRLGFVDAHFPTAVGALPVRIVNLRDADFAECRLELQQIAGEVQKACRRRLDRRLRTERRGISDGVSSYNRTNSTPDERGRAGNFALVPPPVAAGRGRFFAGRADLGRWLGLGGQVPTVRAARRPRR